MYISTCANFDINF